MGEILPFTVVVIQDTASFGELKKQQEAKQDSFSMVVFEAGIEAILDDMERHASLLRAQAYGYGAQAESEYDPYRQGSYHARHDVSIREARRWEQRAMDIRRKVKELTHALER